MNKKTKEHLLIIATAIVGVCLIDLFFGNFFLEKIRKIQSLRLEEVGILERKIRIKNDFFHHSLRENYAGHLFWGERKYLICTNSFGMKDTCDKNKQVGKEIDIAFIGDSFTEGIGLTYEQSFVGQIARSLPSLRIGNLGVSSYSPSIYLVKVKKMLEQGVKIKDLVVYIDISDIQDEATSYLLRDGRVVDLPKQVSKTNEEITKDKKIKLLRRLFPLTYNALYDLKYKIRRKIDLSDESKWINTRLAVNRDLVRGAWTYDAQVTGYGEFGVDGAILKAINAMEELYKIAKVNNIRLSVGVYPWPSQLLYDSVESRQVIIWREFCEKRCYRFINSFPSFFEYSASKGARNTIDELYYLDDVHFNERGSTIIANDFIKRFYSPPGSH